MQSRRSVLFAAVGASVLTALVIGGMAWATIPAGDGTISACYDKQSGQMRIYDPAGGPIKPCGKTENPLTWNQAGAQGPPGISHAYQVSDPDFSDALTDTPTEILSLSLPAGKYVVFGKTNSIINGNLVTCTLDAGSSQLDRTVVGNDFRDAVALEATVNFASTGTVSMNCTSPPTGGPEASGVADSQLIAMAVNALN